MIDYNIEISQVEEWQTIKNIRELQLVFKKAKSTIVQGGRVLLNRKNSDGTVYTADEISTENDLKKYEETVFRYLPMEG